VRRKQKKRRTVPHRNAPLRDARYPDQAISQNARGGAPPINLQAVNRRSNRVTAKLDKNTDMKKLLIPLLALCASAAIAAEQTTTSTTTTTTSTGTISEFSPGQTFIVKETSGPVTYRYGKKVTYVTKKGKTLTDDEVRTRIRVGLPVSVHYMTEGDARVINRVEIDDD
jgi:hypothetical protein